MVAGCWDWSPRWGCATDLPFAQDPLDRVAGAGASLAPGGGTRAGTEKRAAVRLEEARPGRSEGRVCGVKQDHLLYFPAEEEAVDAAREDVGPNAHGSDRRGSVQRDGLRCGQSGLQSHHS